MSNYIAGALFLGSILWIFGNVFALLYCWIGVISCYDSQRIKPIFATYDFWMGVYFDREKRVYYWFPIPCFGLKFYGIKRGEK